MKVAFVIPWFHASISGGAETQCREAALLLEGHRHDVTILTTCIGDHGSDWNINRFPAGPATEGGLNVLRFPAAPRDRRRFDIINKKYIAMNDGKKGRRPREEEQFFFGAMAPSPALLTYLEKDAARYDFVIFMPYLFATSLYGPALCGERSVLLPCLHDEGYAYSGPVAEAFADAGAVIFNTEAEQSLAGRLFPKIPRRQAVIGDSIDPAASRGDADRFRRRFGIEEPFLLCLGRRDSTKGTDRLVSYMLAWQKDRSRPVRLVLAGPGDIRLPRHGGIDDLGFLSEEEKYDTLAACTLLCNPSRNESFSIVLLEAWANGRPVLVSSACPPTVDLCRRSGGGLAYGSYGEFCGAVDYLLAQGGEADAMGERGLAFLKDNYSSSVIGQKYHETLTAWQAGENLRGKVQEENPPAVPLWRKGAGAERCLSEPPLFDISPPGGFLPRLRKLLFPKGRR